MDSQNPIQSEVIIFVFMESLALALGFSIMKLKLTSILEIKATEEEMYLARIPVNRRDYCGHFLIELAKCKRENFPFNKRCDHEVHEWHNCQSEE